MHVNVDKLLFDAQAVARQSMQYASYLGHIISFLERASSTLTDKSLLDLLHTTIENLNLTPHIATYDGINEGLSISNLTEKQRLAMTSARWESRILRREAELYFSWDNLSLLITDMPVDNEESYGVHIDSLAILMNGADNRLGEIRTRQVWDMGIKHLTELINESEANLENDISHFRNSLIELTEEASYDMYEAIRLLGISVQQEKEIKKLIFDRITEVNGQIRQEQYIGDALERLLFCVNEINKRHFHEYNSEEVDNKESYEAVELF